MKEVCVAHHHSIEICCWNAFNYWEGLLWSMFLIWSKRDNVIIITIIYCMLHIAYDFSYIMRLLLFNNLWHTKYKKHVFVVAWYCCLAWFISLKFLHSSLVSCFSMKESSFLRQNTHLLHLRCRECVKS